MLLYHSCGLVQWFGMGCVHVTFGIIHVFAAHGLPQVEVPGLPGFVGRLIQFASLL
jgi:hypothetical protein